MKKAGVILILLLAWFAIADRRGQLMQQHPPSGFSFCSTDLVLWIEATRATSANNPIQNGDTITGMTDASCSNNAITIHGSPKYITSGGGSNNLPYMVVTNDSGFTGSYNLYTSPTSTVVIVVRIDRVGGPSGGYIFGGHTGFDSDAPQFYYDLNGTVSCNGCYDIYNGTHLATADGTVITNKWHVLTVLMNGASSLIRTNGATAKSGNAGLAGGLINPWAVGWISYNNFSYMNGAILRCLIWKRPLSAAEYQAVEAQCNTDFGLY